MRLAPHMTFVFLTTCSGAKTLPAPSDKGVSIGTSVKKPSAPREARSLQATARSFHSQ